MPQLLPEALRDGQTGRAFKLRVAANVLSIVERELSFATLADAEEHVLLVALLGHGGTPEALQRELCARIRDGSLDMQREQVLAYAHVLTKHKLEIANPSYR